MRSLLLKMDETVVKIPFCEPFVADGYAQAVANQIQSGFWGPGGRVAEFGRVLAQHHRTEFCALTVSGTVALSVAARALGLKPGAEIILPAYGVISVIQAFTDVGLCPRLADVDPLSGTITRASVDRVLTAKTAAVCFVNFSGYTGPHLVEVAALCRERALPLIEDAACALGQAYLGTPSGCTGKIGTLSFSVPKLVTTGQGGALLTNDTKLYNAAAAYIDQGDLEWRKTGITRGYGTNLRLSDIQAAFGLAQFEKLAMLQQRKAAVHRILKESLGSYLFEIPGELGPLHNVVYARDTATVLAKLQACGISATTQYRVLYQHPPYSSLRGETELRGAEAWERHAVYLPFGLALTEELAGRIALKVHELHGDLLTVDQFVGVASSA